jgi:hypothetical protein
LSPRARCLAVSLVLVATPARAHDFRPGVLVIDLAADGALALRVQLPPEHRDTPLTFILPAHCRVTRPLPALRAACDPASPGDITLKDLPPDLELVAHVRIEDTPPRSTILRADAPTLSLTDTPADPFLRYLALGVEHILGGPDHLLVRRRPRRCGSAAPRRACSRP